MTDQLVNGSSTDGRFLGRSPQPLGVRDLTSRYLDMWFTLTNQGLIEYRPKALRFGLEGCAGGNFLLIREDVSKNAREELEAWFQKEPPLSLPHSHPLYWERYVEILNSESTIEEHSDVSLAYSFPEDFSYHSEVRVVTSESATGQQLVTDVEVIDRTSAWWDLTKIRAPWCIALANSEVASIVETVNTGRREIECGVKTAPHLRRRGFAAAALSGWFPIARKDQRLCFYSTEIENDSSQRLAKHIGLQFLGPGFGLR